MSKIMHSIYKYTIVLFLIPMFLFLLYMSLNSTSYLTYAEQAFYLQDSFIKNILFLILATIFFIVLFNMNFVKSIRAFFEKSQKAYWISAVLISALLLAISVFWVLSTQYNPFGDSFLLHRAAVNYGNGDFSDFADGNFNYLMLYPFQVRTLLLFRCIDVLFGGYSLVIYQLLNCVGIVIIYNCLANISGYMGADHFTKLLILLVGIVWYPLTLYTSFIYGNVLALAFSLLAVCFFLNYFKNGKIIFAVLSGISICISYSFKGLFVITFIAMLIYGAFKMIITPCKGRIAGILICCVLMLLTSVFPAKIVEKKINRPLSGGMAMIACIDMGLTEHSRAPGWYTEDAVLDYCYVDWDTARHEEVAKEHIAEAIKLFSEDHNYAKSFFLRKMASQWNDPTFQCFWILRDSNIDVNPSIQNFASYKGYVKNTAYLDLWHILILFGALLFILFNEEKQKSPEALFLGIIFIGFFLFLIVWEAKAQYTLLATVLLIPMCVLGFCNLAIKIANLIERIKNKKEKETSAASSVSFKIFTYVLTVIVLALLIGFHAGGNTSIITGDNYNYADYLQEIN